MEAESKFLDIYRLFLLYPHPVWQLYDIESLLLPRYRATAAVLRAVTKERTVDGFPSGLFYIFTKYLCDQINDIEKGWTCNTLGYMKSEYKILA
jgi:hypothetical protein